MKNHAYYLFDNRINAKYLDQNKIKINEKPYKNIQIYCSGYVTIKGLIYVKINSVNALYRIASKINGYIEKK